MFTSFARRLTAWYVVAAVVSVTALLGALAIVALFSYVHFVNDGIDADAREAEAFSARAVTRHEPFVQAASEIETRLARNGIRMVAAGPFPPRPNRGPRLTSVPLLIKPGANGHSPPMPPQARDFPRPTTVVGGRVVQGDPRSLRLNGSRIGFALGTLTGARVNRLDFAGGELAMLPDPDATVRFALLLLAAVLGASAAAGVLAWVVGRYITSQVLQPLVEVTRALQRFAGRDFTPQPIAVAGKSDFDAIALAYNAAAAQVAAAFAERQAAETQMRQFVADAGHELRTPLTIVLGYIDLLRRKVEAGDERSRRIFASIGAEGARMRILIDNLVLLARMEGEDVRPAEPFALRPLLEEIVDARRVLAPAVPFALDVPVAATVIGNRDEIHEAIANVVDNAIKYAPGAPIRISAAAADGGVEVTVADAGPGIHPEDRAGIFDRFYRGATRGEVEGSGLGLAIAKRAVERAGGTLDLKQTGDDGTTFAFKLRTDGVPTSASPPTHV
jgi:signal transduction histidine kinase